MVRENNVSGIFNVNKFTHIYGVVNKLNILLIIIFNAEPTFAIEINIPEGNKKSTNIKQKF